MADTTRDTLSYVQCPVCGWRCLHHGRRSDGLSVSWRSPADQPASDNPTDRAFVRQYAQMRFHARGHFSEVAGGKVNAGQVHVALSCIPTIRKKVSGDTPHERNAERKKRRQLQARDYSMRYRKRLKAQKEEAKLRQVCAMVGCACSDPSPIFSARRGT